MTTTLAERVANRVSDMLAGRHHDRRRFLRQAAVVGSALAVNPFGYLLKPGTAYAQTCGPANECAEGWSAFCCTINAGANTCPPGSFVAGWWKVTSSAFCRGEDRYIIDCNRIPGTHCSCHCASHECDRRRVCCNTFRYGQCNQQVAGTTQVVCRVIICTPPWEWDPTCTTTVRTDNATRNHTSTCLPGPNPSLIAIAYQDLGLVGSVLGAVTVAETDGPRGGRWAGYEHGAITWAESLGLHVVPGPAGERYVALNGPYSALGYAIAAPTDVGDGRGELAAFEGGAIWSTPETGAWEVFGPLRDRYLVEGGPTGWLGYPETGVEPAPGGRERTFFEAGWMLVHDPSTGEVRLFPEDVELPDEPGEWPITAEVVRWAGDDRIGTAVRVSEETFGDGTPVAFLARADEFADALVGGVWAGLEGGPVLLAAHDDLPEATADELRRLAPERVVVLGGESAIAEDVLAQVADLLPDAEVERVAGDSRFETAARVSEAAFGEGDVRLVLLATGRSFADALAAAPAAAIHRSPILLVEPTALPAATAAELARLAPREIAVLGGTDAISDEVAAEAGSVADAEVERWAGADRYETALEITTHTFGSAETVFIATGESFADGLAAGPAAIAEGAPLLLVGRDTLPYAAYAILRPLAPRRIVIVGGEAAVSASVAERLAGLPTTASPERAKRR